MKMFCATVRSGIRLNSWWMMLMPSSCACRGLVERELAPVHAGTRRRPGV